MSVSDWGVMGVGEWAAVVGIIICAVCFFYWLGIKSRAPKKKKKNGPGDCRLKT